jgi:hypothetical protein
MQPAVRAGVSCGWELATAAALSGPDPLQASTMLLGGWRAAVSGTVPPVAPRPPVRLGGTTGGELISHGTSQAICVRRRSRVRSHAGRGPHRDPPRAARAASHAPARRESRRAARGRARRRPAARAPGVTAPPPHSLESGLRVVARAPQNPAAARQPHSQRCTYIHSASSSLNSPSLSNCPSLSTPRPSVLVSTPRHAHRGRGLAGPDLLGR